MQLDIRAAFSVCLVLGDEFIGESPFNRPGGGGGGSFFLFISTQLSGALKMYLMFI